MSKWTKTLVALVGLAMILFGIRAMLEQSVSVKRNINRYDEYVKEFPFQDLVNHFPPRIADPDRAQVAYSTGPLQANAFLQLRLDLDATSVALIGGAASTNAIRAYQGGGMYTHFNEDNTNNLPTAIFRTSPSESCDGSFPAHFVLYVFSAARDGTEWKTSGIAVSTKTNTVVYWAEGS